MNEPPANPALVGLRSRQVFKVLQPWLIWQRDVLEERLRLRVNGWNYVSRKLPAGRWIIDGNDGCARARVMGKISVTLGDCRNDGVLIEWRRIARQKRAHKHEIAGAGFQQMRNLRWSDEHHARSIVVIRWLHDGRSRY